jgi:hypothetical protein
VWLVSVSEEGAALILRKTPKILPTAQAVEEAAAGVFYQDR